MPNFPVYGYQPQAATAYGQMMQPQPYGYQQIAPPQAQQEQMLYCRMVTSPEEARGVPVDFGGRPMTFLDLPHGRIYVKAFDAGSGSAVFREFWIHEDAPQPEPQAPAFAEAAAVKTLQETVARLEAEVQQLKAQKAANLGGENA